MRPARATLDAAYAAAVLWEPHGDGWRPLTVTAGPWLVITAANPWSLALTPAINDARDCILATELRAQGLEPRRVRAAAPDGTWHEDGWLVAHTPELARTLMCRYQQAGVYVLHDGRREVWWDESMFGTQL